MQALFLKEAEKYHVLPMDDRVFERLNAELVGRPDLMGGRTSLTLAEGMTGMMEERVHQREEPSKTITAEIEVPQGRRQRHRSSRRVAASAAGRCTSRTACRPTTTTSSAAAHLDRRPASRWRRASHDRASSSPTTAAAPARAARARSSSTARRSPKGPASRTQAESMFSADETADVGIDLGTPVVEAIGGLMVFGGAEGKGVLHFKGKDYPFTMSGVTVGGVGYTEAHGTANVYFLKNIEDFPGNYQGIGAGAAVGVSKGGNTFQNMKEVVITTKSKGEGAALNLGVSSISIKLVK
jgi:hypothetical protein